MAVIIPVQADDTQFLAAMADMESSARKSSKSVKDALNGAAGAVENLGGSADAAADGIGKFGSGAGKVSGAIDLLVPGLGNATRGLADIADVGEVVATAAASLGVTFEGLIATVAPLALIIGGVALAWSSYSESVKEAAEFQERLNTALDSVDGIATATRAEIDKLRNNIGLLSDEEYANVKIKEAWADRLEKGTAKLNEEKTALEEQMKTIGTANAEYLRLQDRLHEVNGLLDTATNLNKQGEEAALANAEIARERAESEGVLADRLKAKAESERAAAKATAESTKKARENAAALKKVTDSTKQLRDALYEVQMLAAEGQLAPGEKDIRNASAAFTELSTKMFGVVSAYEGSAKKSKDARRALEDLKLSAIDLDLAFSRGEITQEEYERGLAANKKAADDLARSLPQVSAGIQAITKAFHSEVINKFVNDLGTLKAAWIDIADSKVVTKFKGAMSAISSAYAKAISGAASVVQNVMSAIGFNFSSIMKAAGSEDGPQAAIAEMATQAKVFISALPGAIKAFVAELPGVLHTLVQMAPSIVQSIVDSLPLLIDAVVSELPNIVQMLSKQLPKLIIAIVNELPGLVVALAHEIPILVDALVKALPDIITAIIEALPSILAALIKMTFVLIGVLIKGLPAIIKALAVGLKNMLVDLMKEIFSGGKANTSFDAGKKSYGDSPGIVRAGPQGMTVQASPGDYVNIGRNRQQLLDRALSGSGVAHPAPAAVAPAPVLVLNDHVRQWDKLGYRLARTGGLSVDISNRTTKNARGR